MASVIPRRVANPFRKSFGNSEQLQAQKEEVICLTYKRLEFSSGRAPNSTETQKALK